MCLPTQRTPSTCIINLRLRYPDCWRRQRKLFHYAQLNCTIANPIYLTTINENLRRALTEITTRPDSWHEILSGYISGVTSDLAFGTQVTAFDEYIPRFWAAAADIGEKNALPGVFIVNLFPWLRFFPPFRWHDRKRLEDEKHFIYERFYGVQEELEEAEKASISVPNQNLFERNELQQSKDSIRWSIARLYFQNKSRWSDMSDHEAAYTLAAFVMASLAGTPGTMKLVFWALMLFPEWQTRIYEEVRRVCGDRVVELKDKEFMPVTRAVMKEAVRWRPMGPGGFPHTLMEDDAYRGWRVPKGALVMWHHWFVLRTLSRFPSLHTIQSRPLMRPLLCRTISRDSTAFPNPETFDPDRFLDPSSPAYQAPLTQHPTLTLDPGFGYGRRACPGVSQAEDMMLMFFGTFFRRFELRRRKGRDGREEEIHSYDYVEGRTTRPAWFGLEIVERGREE